MTTSAHEGDPDGDFRLRRCIRIAREQAALAEREALAYRTILTVHGPDSDEVDVPAIEQSLAEQTWTVGQLARVALQQLEARGISYSETYQRVAKARARRDFELYDNEELGPISLIGDAIRHLDEAGQSCQRDPAAAGEALAAAAIQLQLVALFLGMLDNCRESLTPELRELLRPDAGPTHR